jgi:hypothetical protein
VSVAKCNLQLLSHSSAVGPTEPAWATSTIPPSPLGSLSLSLSPSLLLSLSPCVPSLFSLSVLSLFFRICQVLEPVRAEAVLPDRALCLPTFSHFLIVNKTSLSLSLSFSLSLSLSLSLCLSFGICLYQLVNGLPRCARLLQLLFCVLQFLFG